jgi:hypothetical protein
MFGFFKKKENHRELWSDYLKSMPEGSDEEAEMRPVIENFIIPDNINFNKFMANISLLLNSGMARSAPSVSARRFQDRLNRPGGYPLWFLACYPDVASWFTDTCDQNVNDLAKAYEPIFGNFNEATFEQELIDQNMQKIKVSKLRKLINYYLANISSTLECNG